MSPTDPGRVERAAAVTGSRQFLVAVAAGLFVVIEGFNKLKLKDARVQRLFQSHIQHLKTSRHETYHFVVERSRGEIISQLNWAEDLHKAIGSCIEAYVKKRAKDEEPAGRKKRASSSLKVRRRELSS
jgi:hypothetical protein